MPDTYVSSGWACVDCLFLFANGDAPADWPEEKVAAWQADIDRITAGLDVTLGMLSADHDCATNYTVTDTTGTQEFKATSADDAFSQLEFSDAWRDKFVKASEEIAPGELPGQLNLDGTPAEIPAGVTRHRVLFEDGSTDTVTITEHEYVTVDDCECERITFSTSPCDVCDSSLHGERHAMSFFKRGED